jgi:hypothetical protein
LLPEAYPTNSFAVGIFAQISPSSLLKPTKGHTGDGEGESSTFLRGFFFTGFFLATGFFVGLGVAFAVAFFVALAVAFVDGLAVAFAVAAGFTVALAVAFVVGLGVGDFVAAIAFGVSRVNAIRKSRNFFIHETI